MSVQSSRFPFGDEPLNIQIEDRTNGAATLRYVADEPGSGIYRSGTSQSVKIEEWLVTISLTLVQSTISLYILDTLGREKLRLFFDKISFVVFLTGYVVVNLLLVLAAKP